MSDITKEEVDSICSTVRRISDRDTLQRIVEAVHSQQSYIINRAIRTLRSGDKVSFTTRDGLLVKGTVVRTKTKNVEVRSDAGRNWNVTASLLQVES